MMRTSKRFGWTRWLTMVCAGCVLGGCGFTDLEMAAKQREIDALVAQLNALKAGARAANQVDVRPAKPLTSKPELSSR